MIKENAAFSKLLKPICNYIFKAIFKDYSDQVELTDGLSAMPFIKYKAFADSEKFLFDYKIKTDRQLIHYNKLKD
jgi:hypothetical protein